MDLGWHVELRWLQKIKQIDRKIICLIGDGESNEGTIWEAALIASDQKLNNLIVLYDNNNSQKVSSDKKSRKKISKFWF